MTYRFASLPEHRAPSRLRPAACADPGPRRHRASRAANAMLPSLRLPDGRWSTLAAPSYFRFARTADDGAPCRRRRTRPRVRGSAPRCSRLPTAPASAMPATAASSSRRRAAATIEIAAMNAVGEIRQILSDIGFPESSIAVEAYHAGDRYHSPVRLSYLRYVAEAPTCGCYRPTSLTSATTATIRTSAAPTSATSR